MSDARKFTLGDKEYLCVIDLTIDVCGGKWKPLILWHLGNSSVLRFNEIRKHMPTISHKMLSQQLKELEQSGMIHRNVYPEIPPKVEYSLTDLGEDLMPVLKSMGNWGVKYYKANTNRSINRETNI
ncbi:winged helix-turn-helix transcriptional regulator [Anaerosolibacter sp.]|uniref:winged helix-turn-helix transcriptional regulator n=1 Tax=Anaerosolibacter sp. TaxID=1872527 RepID=UPI0039EF1A10